MATAFITAQELSDHLKRDVTADAGTVLAIDGACEIIRTIADQAINEVTETILLDGTGTDMIRLPQLPVSTITTVTVADTATTDYVLGNGMLFKTSGVWTKGRRNVSVKYKHGYSSSAIPDDVRTVALNLAGRLLIQAPKNAIEETVGDVRIKYAVDGTDLTKNELRILRKHSGR